jgi:hypothetical protein
MAEALSLEPVESPQLMIAFDKAQAVQQALLSEFRASPLPVQSVSIIFGNGSGLPGVGVDLTRDPTREEMAQLPNSRDGVYIKYYARKNGQHQTYRDWS